MGEIIYVEIIYKSNLESSIRTRYRHTVRFYDN